MPNEYFVTTVLTRIAIVLWELDIRETETAVKMISDLTLQPVGAHVSSSFMHTVLVKTA